MIKELLTSGGKSSIRTIAAAFLARDASQLEYYEQITKDMPGKVLAKHGIVERDGKDYRLSTDPSSLSSEQRDELVRLCDEAIGETAGQTIDHAPCAFDPSPPRRCARTERRGERSDTRQGSLLR